MGNQKDHATSQQRWQLPPPMLRGASWPQQEVKLTCSSYASSNDKKNTQPGRQTAPSRSCLVSGCCLPPVSVGWAWGAGRQQVPGAHLSIGAPLPKNPSAAPEHTGRKDALRRGLPAATPEPWHDVSPDSPRHAWLKGTGNWWWLTPARAQ